MAEEKKTNQQFQWNSDPSFFSKQQSEEQPITLGPDLSYPLISTPESQDIRSRQHKMRKVSVIHEKAA